MGYSLGGAATQPKIRKYQCRLIAVHPHRLLGVLWLGVAGTYKGLACGVVSQGLQKQGTWSGVGDPDDNKCRLAGWNGYKGLGAFRREVQSRHHIPLQKSQILDVEKKHQRRSTRYYELYSH